MSNSTYLKKILAEQSFSETDQELKDLRKRRQDIEKILRENFSEAKPSIRWAGSMAKGTMIRESYDGDMTCYFPHEEDDAGMTLEDIYKNVQDVLAADYSVEVKASAIRVRALDDWHTDLHIDVVPGRFTDADNDDVFLHRTTGDKERLKTNLQVHIDHIKSSGVTDAIRLTKLWKVRNGLDVAKTFVLELLVVKLLATKKNSSLENQMIHVWSKFRDNADSLSVTDPANSNNDLKPILDQCRHMLSNVAENTLWQIENHGWEAVFGEPEEEASSKSEKIAGLQAAAIHVTTPNKPWLRGG